MNSRTNNNNICDHNSANKNNGDNDNYNGGNVVFANTIIICIARVLLFITQVFNDHKNHNDNNIYRY